MILKRNIQNPQDYIAVGMAFFLLSFITSTVAEGRLIGAFITSWITNESLIDTIQGFADGFTIIMSCASIYFNVRGLYMLRSR